MGFFYLQVGVIIAAVNYGHFKVFGLVVGTIKMFGNAGILFVFYA